MGIDGGALEAWRAAFAASTERTEPALSIATLLPVSVELGDGSIVNGVFTLATGTNFMLSGASVATRADAALQSLVDGVRRELERRHRLAVGKVLDGDELAALPADSRRIECPWFADESLAPRLARFPNLETFVLATGPVTRLGAADVRRLAAIPTLKRLDLRAAEVSPSDLAPLAELRTLRALAIRGCTGIGPRIAQMAPYLEELTLERCAWNGADGHFLGLCKHLVVLRLIDCELASSAAWVETLSLPSLRHLVVRQQELPAAMFDPLQRSKLHSLRLVDMPVSGDDLARLAELPTLRELAVLAATFDDAAASRLGALQQMTTLRLMNTRVGEKGLSDLQQALPKCTIDCVPGRRVFDTAAWAQTGF